MNTQVLICDDSGFARRQIERSMPAAWDVDIHFAENGQQALEQIRAGNGDVMFLDLNMPVMDGYETMEHIRRDDLPCIVIVVSGDVQPEARTKMLAMGALDFIRKPIDNLKLSNLLKQYGLFAGNSAVATPATSNQQQSVGADEKQDAYREMVNVAMGRAGESLARLLGEFIDLPIPNVNMIETNELHMAIAEINHNEAVSIVSKGFVSAGINGEALVIFSDTKIESVIELLKYREQDLATSNIEALMDVSNILIGACLYALSEQLNVSFSHSSPILLAQHRDIDSLLAQSKLRWNKLMAIEIAYAIKSRDINFDLLLLFPESSMERIYTRLVNDDEGVL
jgi:chemotaxis protein CheY-P-specific phosphatase CheC